MKNKNLAIIILVSFIVSVLYLGVVYAKNSNNSEGSVLPEQEGTYDVPGHSNLKLRVFVYRARPDRSTPPSIVCNLPDPDSTATVGPTPWRLPTGTWVYTLNPSSVPSSVGSANLAIMANDAFGRWSSATGAANKILFSQNSSYTIATRASLDAKNIITWGRTQGTALAVTYIWYNKNTGIAVEVDTIMNSKFSWNWSNPETWTSPDATCANANAYDAQDILTHELGHWLGLNDMYNAENYQNATMYGYGSKAEIKKDTLSTGDLVGTAAIYPN